MTQDAAVNRRRFLKLAAGLPLIAGIAAFLDPLIRFLKPNVDPYRLITPTARDTPSGEPVVAASMTELSKPWDFKYFVFTQKYPQYTPEGYKTSAVPGVIVRVPQKVRLPWGWVKAAGETPQFAEGDVIAFSRICPHLGCIYNFVGNWQEVTAGYGGYVPPESRRHALMACPCHLSIYDPADRDVPGRVLSGPAPRPPRTFFYEVQGDQVLVKRVEPGGIA